VSVCVRASERAREMEVSANVHSQQNIFYNHNQTPGHTNTTLQHIFVFQVCMLRRIHRYALQGGEDP